MIIYCVFIHSHSSGHSSIEEPIEFPCRLNVGDNLNPVYLVDLPFNFPKGDWEVTKSGFFNNASEISQRVHLIIKP